MTEFQKMYKKAQKNHDAIIQRREERRLRNDERKPKAKLSDVEKAERKKLRKTHSKGIYAYRTRLENNIQAGNIPTCDQVVRNLKSGTIARIVRRHANESLTNAVLENRMTRWCFLDSSKSAARFAKLEERMRDALMKDKPLRISITSTAANSDIFEVAVAAAIGGMKQHLLGLYNDLPLSVKAKKLRNSKRTYTVKNPNHRKSKPKQ